jgi:hypothetical protein
MVDGKVVRLWETSGKGAGWHVAYEYPASADAGAPVLQSEDLLQTAGDFSRLKVGGPIAVRVCRADPANHLANGAPQRAFSNPVSYPIALAVVATLALAGIANLGWWWACRRRRVGQLSISP